MKCIQFVCLSPPFRRPNGIVLNFKCDSYETSILKFDDEIFVGKRVSKDTVVLVLLVLKYFGLISIFLSLAASAVCVEGGEGSYCSEGDGNAMRYTSSDD